ncbi:hypothetical protein BBJ28_00004918 [Nothophytophthora sp. Chile5]|nr:hypothetical protein BBJ28_00004918 [Nothophytophthora sp. Chile5]
MTSSQAQATVEGPSKTGTRPEVAVRQYRPEDHAGVTKIFVEGLMRFDDNEKFRYLWEERLRIDLTHDFADIEASHMAPGGNFWVAIATSEGKSTVVGIIGLQRRSETMAEVRRIFVDPSCHRMGIGRKLMQLLEQWAKENGYESLCLTTNPKSEQAVGFYTSLGYETRGETELQWETPRYFEALKFAKQL